MYLSISTTFGNQEKARLNLAAAYIRDHLTEALNLEELARTTGFSKFYFHRLFKMQFGEPPGDYIKRLRLEQAAFRLLAGDRRSITDLAYQYGFSSSQHFTGSFKQHYGVPPITVRDRFDWRTILLNKIRIMESGYSKRHCLPAEVEKGKMFIQFPCLHGDAQEGGESRNLEVIRFPRCRVAYVRLKTLPLSEALGQAMQKMFKWSIAEKLFTMDAGLLMTAYEVVPDEEGLFTVDVCATIPENAAIKEYPEIKIRNLQEGLYGVYHGRFQTFDEFAAVREKLMRGWWVSSYYSRDRRPRYVIFYNGPTLDPSVAWLSDLCFPITILP